MKHKLLNYFCLLFLLAFVTGCEEDNKDDFTPKLYKVTGKVEKGPFINGSKITAQALDKDYNLTGEVYQGIIVDDDGSFNLGEIKLNSSYVLLTADGYYFNEVDGELSTGQISLQSIVNLADNKQANINILTHLKTQRMMQLLRNNKPDFNEADAKVQKEVLKSFGLERYAEKDVCNFSIASGTNEAGALIVVSSTLLRDRTDAELTEYLAKLSAEFKAEGTFMDNTKKQLREDAMMLDVNDISDNIISRYKKLNMDVTVPNLNYFIDWDGDGIAGNEPDAGGDMTLTLDKKELSIPAKIGERELTTADKYLLVNGYSLDNMIIHNEEGYFIADISWTDDKKGIVFKNMQSIPEAKAKELLDKQQDKDNISTVEKEQTVVNDLKGRDMEAELKEAIEKDDFEKMSQLRDEGYKPSEEVIRGLSNSPNMDDKKAVVIDKLFGMKPEVPDTESSSTKNKPNQEEVKEASELVNGTPEQDVTFKSAVENGDFAKLDLLKGEGYMPSKEVMQSLAGSVPENSMIAVQKIFGLKSNAQSIGEVKLAQGSQNNSRDVSRGVGNIVNKAFSDL